MLSASSCSSSSKIIALVGVPGRRFRLFPINCGKCMKFNMRNQYYSGIEAILVQTICFLAGIILRIRLSNQRLGYGGLAKYSAWQWACSSTKANSGCKFLCL